MRGASKDSLREAVLMVEIVQGMSLVNYTGNDKKNFAKITMALPKLVAAAKRLLENTKVYDPAGSHIFKAFESNVDIETR